MKSEIRVPEDIPMYLTHDYEQKLPVAQIGAWLIVMTMFIYCFFRYVSSVVLA
jgi:hypothetical protein